jgi:ubiquinone/menaquinone biosynthesis C-methylase UbiE
VATHQPLTLEVSTAANDDIIDGALVSQSGAVYSIREGVPNFTYPEKLQSSDEEFLRKYESGAQQYDVGLEWLFRTFSLDQATVRASTVARLELQPGGRVLEVGCGTGKDTLHIAAALGLSGEIFAQDISPAMLAIARAATAGAAVPIEFFVGNGAYLPFADRQFDAVFHFGGINGFGDITQALAEMTRVARIGGKVVVGDEGVAPWLRERPFGQILINANPLYRHTPPLAALPEAARDVHLNWIVANAFYLIDYRVGEGPQEVDVDLPIPGKGDTLRSRFARRLRG